jgi:hypothetical protein
MIPTPTSVALQARRPLGAYRIPLETGLLIPSDKRDYRNVGMVQPECPNIYAHAVSLTATGNRSKFSSTKRL